MTSRDTQTPITCRNARATLLEGLEASAPGRQALAEHLEGCPSCRSYSEEIRAVDEGLRSLPEVPFPDDALEEVWDRTIGIASGRSAARSRWHGRNRWLAAAAAVIVAALIWMLVPATPPEPTEEEIHRAAVEARLVFDLTARAIERTEEVAVQDVLAERVSPALHKIPMRWPERPARPERSDTP